MAARATYVLVLSALLGLCACGASSKQIGKGAAEGVLSEANEHAGAPHNGAPPAIQRATGNVVQGALSELDDPQRREQLGHIVGTATVDALRSAAGTDPRYAPWGGGPRGFDDTP